MKTTTESVMLFWSEDGKPVGMLYENGHREIFHVTRASKTQLNEIFQAEYIAPEPKSMIGGPGGGQG